MKNINDDTMNKKDEYSNEINILNNKLITQQNSNEEHIKKIQELNTKIKTMQNDTNKLTQKNTEYINKIVLYKEQINNLTEMNEELKIKNKSEITELNNKIKSIEYIPDDEYKYKSISLGDYILKRNKLKSRKTKSCSNVNNI